MAKVIEITQEDRARWFPVLTEYYLNRGKTPAEVPQIVEKVLAECSLGWNRAPRSLDDRIKFKSGFQCPSHANLKPNWSKDHEEPFTIKEEKEESFVLDDHMTKAEKEWFDKRREEYQRDFDFNNSSDKPLLDQLLFEELVQRRLHILQLKNSKVDYSKRLTDSLKRVTETQTKLGITREQRAGVLDKVEGNVAQISVMLQEKLAKMPDNMKHDIEEELYFQSIKDQREPINLLPPIEKMEAMLNVGGKLSVNIDSSKISEITESVAVELKNKREEKENDKQIELPDGTSI